MSAVAGAALRARAASVLVSVLDEGRSLKATLAQELPQIADPRDRALLEAIVFAALRHRRRYEYALAQWLQKALPPRDGAIHALLLAGLAQIEQMRLPAHAAVAATAEAARLLGRAPLVGLVNALLRRATREPLPESTDPAIAGSHPDWLAQRIGADWPDDVAAILAANNQPAPLWLRARAGGRGRDALLADLAAAGIAAEPSPLADAALRVDERGAVERLPGWEAGELVVQDLAAQLAVQALAPAADARVLDACAAPGGKTAQLIECCPRGEVHALDVAPRRLRQVEQLLQRLRLASPRVHTLAADAGDPAVLAGESFDAILLDAPCSATGIIRRQPDIKWHRRADDIAALVATQARLLDACWTRLRPGGRLLYATCSLLQDENSRQVQAFLQRRADAREAVLDARYGRALAVGRQRLPGDDGGDGFYYALLEKSPGPDR